MPLVVWNDRLCVGIPEIDRQHKQLIDRLNALVDAMHANRGKDEIKTIVNFLDIYVAEHFRFEEGCMHKYKCPIAGQNSAAHVQFLTNFKEIKDELDKKGSSIQLAMKVNEQLLDWFVNHIKKIDWQLKPCMDANLK